MMDFSPDTIIAVSEAFNKNEVFAELSLQKLHKLGYHVFSDTEIATIISMALQD